MHILQSLSAVNRDGLTIMAARALRAFAHSAASVVLAIYLDIRGFSLAEIGLFLTIGGFGAAAWALTTGIVGDTLGRRKMLVLISLFTAASGLSLAVAPAYPILVIIGFIGAFTAMAGGSGATGPLEQASLASTASPEKRTEAFALLGIIGTVGVALGALAAGIPDLLQGVFGVDEIKSYQVLFLAYSVVNLLAAGFYASISSEVEIKDVATRWVNPFKLKSRRKIFTLAGLFSVDSFGTGLVAQSLAAYFFFTRFGIEPGSLGLMFFGSAVLTAVSMGVAVRLARRIGLVSTMVFTHIPASMAMIAIPFVPFAWLAVSLWLTRSFFGQMDVPTRQSYTMSIVGPEERSAMASASSVASSSGTALGPSAASILWTTGSSTIPFVAGGVIKIVYDLVLWRLFVSVKPPEESSEASQKPGDGAEPNTSSTPASRAN
jgi:MFS family permease